MSNCLLFALFQWWHYGGYVIVRKSKIGWWPHFMWASSIESLEAIEYVPYEKVEFADKYHLPPIVFKGYVRKAKDLPMYQVSLSICGAKCCIQCLLLLFIRKEKSQKLLRNRNARCLF
jgi:hypothetical protein